MTFSDIPSLRSVWAFSSSVEASFTFLIENGVISVPSRCNACEGNLSVYGIQARCTLRSCRKWISCSINSFFAKSRLPINDTLLLGYIWITGATYSVALSMTSHSSTTIVDYYRFYRGLVADSFDEEDWTIGGEGIIVEIDETKFGKRKNNRGHHVDGVWVVVGMERISKRHMFAVSVEHRNEDTLSDVISNHVLPGSIIHTDCWRGYFFLRNVDEIMYLTVNHSQTFKDPITGVHTNIVEGTNFALKRFIPARNRTAKDLGDRLVSFIWRRQRESNLWNFLLKAFASVLYE